MSQQRRIFVLPTVAELREEEEFLNRRWDDFAHVQGLPLGPQHPVHPTKLVHERRTNKPYVLQSCAQISWTGSRAKLLEIARRSDSFIPPRFMFVYEGNVFVGSEVVYSADGQPAPTLADIIDCTLPISEIQAAAVVRALLELEGKGVMYGRLKASNIFPCQDGRIRLAAFGTDLKPEGMRSLNSGCQELGHLANHMLTRIPRLLGKSQTKDQKLLIQTKSSRIEVDVNREIGAIYLDFLEACMDKDTSLEALSKHKFLNGGPGPECFQINVRHAELTALRY
ncbi:uncharacterized protein PAC_14794 [Phialocephala subalpina]|uniref:Protein kinase domain-containing protein n=1 Tax=Phialocephala subalpina TaxID=576137 RepID=A0A1L7XIP1_9HELO|nr:uncharacterized protein PAC_14794 [Phialocephala subalpina]